MAGSILAPVGSPLVLTGGGNSLIFPEVADGTLTLSLAGRGAGRLRCNRPITVRVRRDIFLAANALAMVASSIIVCMIQVVGLSPQPSITRTNDSVLVLINLLICVTCTHMVVGIDLFNRALHFHGPGSVREVLAASGTGPVFNCTGNDAGRGDSLMMGQRVILGRDRCATSGAGGAVRAGCTGVIACNSAAFGALSAFIRTWLAEDGMIFVICTYSLVRAILVVCVTVTVAQSFNNRTSTNYCTAFRATTIAGIALLCTGGSFRITYFCVNMVAASIPSRVRLINCMTVIAFIVTAMTVSRGNVRRCTIPADSRVLLRIRHPRQHTQAHNQTHEQRKPALAEISPAFLQ